MTRWSQVDNLLTDHEFLGAGGCDDVFEDLRRDEPVHWTETERYGRGFWSVTRHADCLRVLSDPETFSSVAGSNLPQDARALSVQERDSMGWDDQVILCDPPLHDRRRRPFNPHFSVPAISRLRDECDRVVDGLIAEVAARGTADAVEDLAAQVPVRIFLSMMDIPVDDWEEVRTLSLAMLQPENPEFGHLGSDHVSIRAAANAQLFTYLSEHTLARRGHEGDDLATLIANVRYRGDLLTEREAAWMAISIVVGGLETTRNAGAVGILELLRHPDQAALLHDDDVAESAVEETIRWASPARNKLRVATADVELGGATIRSGDWVVAWLLSANRDERVFSQPHTFDVRRNPNPHLAFGDGPHMCLGRNVARLELMVLFRRLFAAFPDIELAGKPQWVHSRNAGGLVRLPIRLGRRAEPTLEPV